MWKIISAFSYLSRGNSFFPSYCLNLENSLPVSLLLCVPGTISVSVTLYLQVFPLNSQFPENYFKEIFLMQQRLNAKGINHTVKSHNNKKQRNKQEKETIYIPNNKGFV